MEKGIIIQLSAEEFKQIISDVVRETIDEKMPQFIPEPKKYLTRQEVAEKFHVTLPTIHSWINSGKIKAFKMGRRTLFELAMLENAVSPKYKRLSY